MQFFFCIRWLGFNTKWVVYIYKTACRLPCFAFFLVFLLHISNLPVWKTIKTTQIQTEDLKRPHVILLIFSADGNELLRQTQLSTWIDHMLKYQDKLSFRITYKLILNRPTNVTIRENFLYIYKDILHIIIPTPQGTTNDSENLHRWLKHIY